MVPMGHKNNLETHSVPVVGSMKVPKMHCMNSMGFIPLTDTIQSIEEKLLLTYYCLLLSYLTQYDSDVMKRLGALQVGRGV